MKADKRTKMDRKVRQMSSTKSQACYFTLSSLSSPGAPAQVQSERVLFSVAMEANVKLWVL